MARKKKRNPELQSLRCNYSIFSSGTHQYTILTYPTGHDRVWYRILWPNLVGLVGCISFFSASRDVDKASRGTTFVAIERFFLSLRQLQSRSGDKKPGITEYISFSSSVRSAKSWEISARYSHSSLLSSLWQSQLISAPITAVTKVNNNTNLGAMLTLRDAMFEWMFHSSRLYIYIFVCESAIISVYVRQRTSHFVVFLCKRCFFKVFEIVRHWLLIMSTVVLR